MNPSSMMMALLFLSGAAAWSPAFGSRAVAVKTPIVNMAARSPTPFAIVRIDEDQEASSRKMWAAGSLVVSVGWACVIQTTATPIALTMMSFMAVSACAMLAAPTYVETEQGDNAETLCYMVNGVEIDNRPMHICTANPQEAAWFIGVSLSQFVLDDVLDPTLSGGECELSYSPKGSEDWICTGDLPTA